MAKIALKDLGRERQRRPSKFAPKPVKKNLSKVQADKKSRQKTGY